MRSPSIIPSQKSPRRRIRIDTPASPFSLPAFVVACLALELALPACDDNKATAPDSAPSAAASSPPPSAPSVTAPPSATPPPHAAPKPHGPCPHEATMTFEDPAMEAVVRRQLQKPTGPIPRAALKGIKTFDISKTTLDDLDPCLFAELTGVHWLYLPPGGIRDLAPLKGLHDLEGLGLAKTAVTDLAQIAGFTRMDRLDLSHLTISDLTPIAGLTLITDLNLDATPVVDLSPLAKMAGLETLSIQDTSVASLTPLHGLMKLKKLYINGSLVTDTSPVGGVRGLKIFQQGR